MPLGQQSKTQFSLPTHLPSPYCNNKSHKLVYKVKRGVDGTIRGGGCTRRAEISEHRYNACGTCNLSSTLLRHIQHAHIGCLKKGRRMVDGARPVKSMIGWQGGGGRSGELESATAAASSMPPLPHCARIVRWEAALPFKSGGKWVQRKVSSQRLIGTSQT